MRPGAYDVHEPRPRHERQRRAGVDVLPDVRRVQRSARCETAPTRTSPRSSCPGVQRLAHRRVAGAYPGRFIPLAVAPVWDLDGDGRRDRRVAAKGCRAVTMPEIPHASGLPELHDARLLGPVLQACVGGHRDVLAHRWGVRTSSSARPTRRRRQPHRARDPGVGARRARSDVRCALQAGSRT